MGVETGPNHHGVVAGVGERPLEFQRLFAEVRGRLLGEPAPALRLGRYVVGERIGAGGMGVVYAGHDPELGRKVAIKLVRPDRVGAGSAGRERLLREAQAMAKISSPHAVTVYEAGTWGEQVFVVMEFVAGTTLTQWLGEAPRGVREVIEVFLQAGRGLEAAHRAGLIHRDFKPDNVLVGEDGRARVADFGLAHAAAEAASPLSRGTLLPGHVLGGSSTATGALIGSLPYMSPEQHRGAAASARSDQFSFCVALWEALHGQRPFVGATAEELRSRVLAGAIAPPPEGARAPASLRRILLRGLQVEPTGRWPDMATLLAALERAGRGRGRAALWLGAAAVVAGVFAAWPEEHVQEDLCKGAGSEIAAVWGEARRSTVRQAFLATGRPEAMEAWSQVAARLDAYAGEWAEAREEACRAANDAERTGPKEQAHLELACLDRSLGELRALVVAFTDDAEGVLGNAVKAAVKLRPLSTCRERPELALQVAPSDPAVAVQVQALGGRLDEIAALLKAGEVARALPRAREAATQAELLGHEFTTAEALVLLGSLQSHAGEFAAAEATLFAAAMAAERGNNLSALVRARTELVVAIGYGQGRGDEALRWGALALNALGRDSGDPIEVRLRTAMGLVQARRGDSEAAANELEQALALAEATLGPDHLGVATVVGHLAALRLEAGESNEARSLLARALEIRRRTLGASHPDTAQTQVRLDALAAAP
ncbi:serine/threonine-protein kinase [Nannocystis bainbridge]|uniref:Serine/threonine-protein kinase n=1 Tax=Nannocystis bainbridge TaxID=2995303 RepID=A0ABT5E6B9_9BACT|nr:serine/threonine-protein kinase [Nannocystis bainbridge]MDC0720347.1 serine/threonine-protein kinase [Nannocystis bainbridge]